MAHQPWLLCDVTLYGVWGTGGMPGTADTESTLWATGAVDRVTVGVIWY